MKLIETGFEGLHLIEFFSAGDQRGGFVKTLQSEQFEEHGLNPKFKESFYSISHAGVLRGMHFQKPPHDHNKLVYCNSGKLIDVVVDIRKQSPTYGQAYSVELNGEKPYGLYIPTGFAHGFEVLEDHTMMTYLVSTIHQPSHDAGIRYDSIPYEWNTKNPVLSDRDQSFERLESFESPF